MKWCLWPVELSNYRWPWITSKLSFQPLQYLGMCSIDTDAKSYTCVMIFTVVTELRDRSKSLSVTYALYAYCLGDGIYYRDRLYRSPIDINKRRWWWWWWWWWWYRLDLLPVISSDFQSYLAVAFFSKSKINQSINQYQSKCKHVQA